MLILFGIDENKKIVSSKTVVVLIDNVEYLLVKFQREQTDIYINNNKYKY